MDKTVFKTQIPSKARKGEFRCFRCRALFALRDGNWIPWEQMQVHLCHSCEKDTREKPERKRD